ncbi:MAG TPA: SPW repeat protein [Baekduia sp.]|jgi:hypothetical protein
MLRQGPLSLTLHSLLEPVLAALLIAAPFLFGFSDQGAPTAVAIIAGIEVLVVAMSTDWRVSLIRAVPIAAHLAIDFGLAVVLIAAPFLFGFSDQGAPTAFFIIIGVLLLLVVLGTRWYPEVGEGERHGLLRRRKGAAPNGGADDLPGSQPTR